MHLFMILGKLLLTSALLYGYYYAFLRNRYHHVFNRFYLLAASVLSLVLGCVTIPLYVGSPDAAARPLVNTLRTISATTWGESEGGAAAAGKGQAWLTVADAGLALLCLGVAAGAVLLVRSLLYIARMKRKYNYEEVSGVRLYDTEEPGAPFSFFRLVFWHQRIPFDSKEGQQVFRHELFHARQRHSADILWMEICCICCWFNPFFHLMKRELRAVHEFLADEYAVSRNDRLEYAEMLLLQTMEQRSAPLTSPMFHETFKRRITMITKMNGIRHGYRSRLMIAPMVLALFCMMAFRAARRPAGASRNVQPLTVMIDAGHGGVDPGSQVGNYPAEKVLALQLAMTVKEMAKDYNVRVVMTREEDILPGHADNKQDGLANRVAMTKEAGASAFVSLHVNWAGKESNDEQHSGFQVYVSKRQDDSASARLGGIVVQQLSKIYETLPELLRRDEHIYVLDHNICPAILVECGFINNPKDARFIQSKENQRTIARSILQGIVDFQTPR